MPTISLCMIVKNEEMHIARCLDSVAGLADEIIIIDTGSDDRTKEIASGYTSKVYSYPWKDDFSEARNYSFSKASMDYCMWLDADDILEEAGKEETVYIFADQNGNAEQTIVSEWLKNPERKDRLCDVSDLKEIENVKGDETFEQNGSVLDWKADGNDIYYQGTTSKEAPVTEKITYYLDVKEISAKELAGKSGTVTIRFDYSNHQKEGDVYVPFLVISGMVLDSRCSNIQVTNGKVISNGEKQIVVGDSLFASPFL